MTKVIDGVEARTADAGEPLASPRARVGRSTVALVALIVVLSAGMGAYVSRVLLGRPASSYSVTAAAASWVQAPNPGSAAWFRLASTLPAEPVGATLVIDARDTYRTWINGVVVSTNRAEARAGARPIGAAVDVRSRLRRGANVVAVQVSGLGEQSAALRLALQVVLPGGRTLNLRTGGAGWLATSDAALTATRLGDQPGFIGAGFSTRGWVPPTTTADVRPVRTPVPEQVLEATDSAAAMGVVSTSGGDTVFRARFDLARSAQDGWLRIAAKGSATVAVGNTVLADLSAPAYVSPNSHRAATLWLIHIPDRLSAGTNEVSVRVSSSGATAVALDLLVRTGNRWIRLADSDLRWSASTLGTADTVAHRDGVQGLALWPNGYVQRDASFGKHGTPWPAIWLGALAGLLISGLLLAPARRRAPTPDRVPAVAIVPLGRVLLVLMPAVAVVLAALVYGRWITVAPGFAYQPGVLVAAILAAAGVPVVAALSKYVSPLTRIRRRMWEARPAARLAVVAIALTTTCALSYRLDRQPLWQDEATSIDVARAIHQHGLPRLPSGLYYFKAELYHAVLSVVLTFTDSTTALRSISLIWFFGTVLVFGLLLMPVLTDRPGLVVAATALFVLVPADTAWARDIRMYQQMQFFVVAFLALYLRALRDGRRRDIVLSAVAMVAMYLSHEETFVILPAVPLTAALASRSVWRNRRAFLSAYGPAFLVIAGQYGLSKIHPVNFGDDLSNRPYVGWDPHQASFYYQTIFFAPLRQATLALLSTLALVAVVVSVRRRDRAPALLGLMMCVTVAAASLIFTAKVARYTFATYPMLVALAVLGGAALLDGLAQLCGRERARGRPDGRAGLTSRWIRTGTALTGALLAATTVLSLGTAPRDYGQWVADLTSAPNPLTHSDFGSTLAYLRSHLRPGDQVVTLSPPVMTERYLGRRPDRVIQTGRNKLLYLVLREGRPVETLLGVPVLLTGPALRTFVEAHRRVWLVSDIGSYIQGVPPDLRSEIRSDFTVVDQDATTTVSLRDEG